MKELVGLLRWSLRIGRRGRAGPGTSWAKGDLKAPGAKPDYIRARFAATRELGSAKRGAFVKPMKAVALLATRELFDRLGAPI